MHTLSTAFQTLANNYGNRFSRSAALRAQHGGGETHHAVAAPDAVFFAESTEEVAEAVRLCAAESIPVIAFGAGTSLEGHLAATKGGLSLDLTHMRKVLRRQSGGSRLHRRSRRDARRSQCLSARSGPVLPRRSRCQCDHRRHGGDARLRHQCRPLRHHARQRVVADRRAGQRRGDPHVEPCPQIGCRL